MKLYQVEVDAIQAWLNTMMSKAPNTRKFKLRVLAAVIEYAAKRRWTRERNPCKDVRVGDIGGQRWDLRALDIDEVRRLLAVADQHRPDVANLIRIEVYCGVRVGEARAIRWNDIADGRLRIDEHMNQEGCVSVPKSQAGVRVVPLGPICIARPEGTKDTDFVFDIPYETIRYHVRHCLDAAGIKVGKGWCTHGFRRTHATLMKAAGARALAEQLGHATEQMSEHYVRESFADHAAAVGRIAKMIERVM